MLERLRLFLLSSNICQGKLAARGYYESTGIYKEHLTMKCRKDFENQKPWHETADSMVKKKKKQQ